MLRALCTRLQAAGYTADSLRRLLDIAQPDDVGLLNHSPALKRIRDERTPAGTLIRLFFLEEQETAARAATVLSRQLCERPSIWPPHNHCSHSTEGWLLMPARCGAGSATYAGCASTREPSCSSSPSKRPRRTWKSSRPNPVSSPSR